MPEVKTKEADYSVKELSGKTIGGTGGLPKKRYWTPDGREIHAIEAMITYVDKETGASGEIDSNIYERGWLPSPPVNPLPYCKGCDNWHKTQEEVEKCIENKRVKAEKWDKWAKKNQKGEAMEQAKEMEKMREEMRELKGMLHQALHPELYKEK